MSTGKRLIQIYIHPDSGPITPMALDLDAVEVAINKVPTANSSDEAAVREIAQQIRNKFKGLEPESNRRQLAMIMRRWANAEGFNGMVLRLPGNINGKEIGTTIADVSQSSQLLEKMSQLASALESERRAHAALKLRVPGLETENKRLKFLYERANSELIDKRLQERQMQARARQHESAMRQAREDMDQAIQEVNALKTRMDSMQQQLRLQDHYEKELAQLRQKERSAHQAEQQVRDSLEKLQQDYMALQDEIRRLTEGSFLEGVEADTSDPYSL